MSDWMDCPVDKVIVCFASGNILTGLDEHGEEIALSPAQKGEIDALRRKYRAEHYRLAVGLYTKVEEIRSILRNDTLTDADRALLLAKVDEHTSILNNIEKLFVNTVFEAFQKLQPAQVAAVRNRNDERMRVFGGSRIIGSL